jgi:hypothetical protein
VQRKEVDVDGVPLRATRLVNSTIDFKNLAMWVGVFDVTLSSMSAQSVNELEWIKVACFLPSVRRGLCPSPVHRTPLAFVADFELRIIDIANIQDEPSAENRRLRDSEDGRYLELVLHTFQVSHRSLQESVGSAYRCDIKDNSISYMASQRSKILIRIRTEWQRLYSYMM